MACVSKAAFCSAHEADKLLTNYFDNHLRGGEAFHYLFADGFFGYGVCEILGNLVVNIGFKQSHSHLTHCAANIGLGQAAFAAKIFECVFKPF